MELTLNLIWVALAATALWRWFTHVRSQHHVAQKMVRGMVALGCALLLFFPVISASDDLHAATAAMEDYSLSARKLRAATQHASPVGPAVFVAIAAALLLIPNCSSEHVAADPLTRTTSAASPLAGRGPPPPHLA